MDIKTLLDAALTVSGPVAMDMAASPVGPGLIGVKLQKTEPAAQKKEAEQVHAAGCPLCRSLTLSPETMARRIIPIVISSVPIILSGSG